MGGQADAADRALAASSQGPNERLIGYDVKDVSKIEGIVTGSWTIAEDGESISFKIRQGINFASGNPLTAEDAVFSLQRAVLLDKPP